jgi:uncharacterized protein YggE
VPDDGRPTVTASGTGRVEVAADRAVATFVVEGTRPTAAAARAAGAEAADAVLAALAGAGVDREDLRTAGLDLAPQWDHDGTRPVRRGFTVTNRIAATVRDLDAVGRVLDAGLEAGATGLDGVVFQVADPGPAATEARRQAVADARDRAATIAGAAGLALGSLASIVEGVAVPSPRGRPEARLAFAAVADAAPTPVLPGRIEVTVTVTATWELA